MLLPLRKACTIFGKPPDEPLYTLPGQDPFMIDIYRKLLAFLFLYACLSVPGSAQVPDQLTRAIEARTAEDKARDGARHPAETLDFFDVEPGMTVAEALPGGGWYTRILAPYLGRDGTLYGVNYADRMWSMFSFATEDWIASRIESTREFTELVAQFTGNGIRALGFTFESVPPKVVGTVDRVLMIRALHNLNRFEAEAGTLTRALAAVREMLKDDGLVGVVQHRAPEDASDDWANGSNGYLKQSSVIAAFEQAGFQLVARSEINANPKDKPGPGDIVWRLPPSLRTSKDDPRLRATMLDIGESDRMTLLFRKSR
jgi:predicted methyltransferase